jgi:two-component system LytT family response regulator
VRKIRTVLADDEAPARKELRRLLQVHPEIELVGEAKDGDEAVELIQKHGPDLVFLDVRMPGRDGFAVLDALEPPLPEVIFSTAYDQFAVDAVRRGALDYLLKPIAPEDLAQAIRRAEEKILARVGSAGRGKGDRLALQDRVFIRDGKKALFVEVGSIRCLESEGNYTKIFAPEGHILMRRPIKYFETRLDPTVFFRANRAQVINLRKVREWQPQGEGKLVAVLDDGTSVEISRRQARLFREKSQL